MATIDARQSGGNPAERTTRWLIVGHKFDVCRPPWWISLRGNEKLPELEFPQEIELDLPEWCVPKQDCRLVLPHSARFAAGKQHRANLHSVADGTGDAERRMPSVRIRARKPPRPLRNSFAPGPIARFIQSQGRLSSVP